MPSSNVPPWTTMMFNCQNAREVIIVAPYIKTGALAPVLECIAPDAGLTCVSRWTPQDIASGATDLECRALTLARNGKFLLHNGLHAKYYRFDDRVLIGSANLTQAGMNLAGHGNLEILCPAPPEFDSARFESNLMSQSYPVSDNDFALWNQIVPNQPFPNEASKPAFPGPDAWMPATRRPEYLWLVHQQRSDRIPSDEQRKLAENEIALLGIPPGIGEAEFANWVRLSLLASPFVKDVLDTAGQPVGSAWDSVSERWEISKQEAAHYISTAEYWIAYFIPDRTVLRPGDAGAR